MGKSWYGEHLGWTWHMTHDTWPRESMEGMLGWLQTFKFMSYRLSCATQQSIMAAEVVKAKQKLGPEQVEFSYGSQ